MDAKEDTKTLYIVIEISLPDDPSEDIDGRSKELEIDAAEEVRRIPGVKLFHDPMNTGRKQGSYIEGRIQHRVQPDIHGTYYGQPFVIDTKLKEKSYVDRRDVDKLYRDAEVLGATPVMVHSGGKISEDMKADIEEGGVYIGVEYQKPGWREQFRRNFVAAFQ